MTAPPLPAQWFDGVRAAAQPCELGWHEGGLLLTTPDAVVRRYPVAQVVWPEQTRHGMRQVLLPDGGVVALPDGPAWDRWAASVGLTQPLLVRWARHWPAVGVSLLLLVGLLVVAWRWGIPLAAEQLTRWTPPSLEAQMGRNVMREMERRAWLLPSTVPPQQVSRIADAVAQLVQRGYPEGTAPPHQLHLRQAPDWLGPNAFALPGGDIVLTDALVKLLRGADGSVSPALLGVVGHELGHVRGRHGLHLVFESGALAVLAGWWIGDYSALLAAVPAMAADAAYSRDHERAADAEAVRLMRTSGLDPAAMVTFFKALERALPDRDGDNDQFGLSNHPVDSERIRFFQAAGR